MKKLFPILFLLIFFISCNKIDNPIPETYGIDWSLFPGDPSYYPDSINPWNFSNPDSNWTTNTNTERNILLEDFTGHKCIGCPAAADIAKQLEDNDPRVIVASIHASPSGNFQAVDGIEFIIDFTTPSGTTYAKEISGFPWNPIGTINRKDGGYLGTNWHLHSNWITTVNNELSSATLIANLQLQYNYFEQTNALFVHTQTEYKSKN